MRRFNRALQAIIFSCLTIVRTFLVFILKGMATKTDNRRTSTGDADRDQFFKATGVDLRAFELSRSVEEYPNFQSMFLSLDPQGHRFWKLDKELREGSFRTLFLHKLGVEKLSLLLQALQTKTAMAEFVHIDCSTAAECSECGEYVKFATNGVTLRVSAPCQCPPEGPIEFELNVPSGEMVYADDLREFFNILGDYNINCRLGLTKQSTAMAKIGCAHGFVGNSCPGVYRVDDNTFAIANVDEDDDSGEPINPPGEQVGSICTDLWWYSFVDADEYERRGGKKDDSVDRLKVRPGVYKFSHNLRNGRGDRTFVYATFTWAREPDPVQDYLKEFREADFTAGQVIANQMERWPTLYYGEDAAMAAANHFFCVNGGGGNWHPNGFVQYDPDMSKDTVGVEIPHFDKPYHWYPLSEYSAIVAAVGLSADKARMHLNPSFVALARNVLQCMIKHGTIPPRISSWEERGDPNVELAKQCLVRLNELYN